MKGLGEALWREKELLALAWVDETLSTVKGIAFECLVGGD